MLRGERRPLAGRQRRGRAAGEPGGDRAEAVTIPVVANGDVAGLAEARACLSASGAAAVMIGRAAVGRAAGEPGGDRPDEPGPADRRPPDHHRGGPRGRQAGAAARRAGGARRGALRGAARPLRRPDGGAPRPQGEGAAEQAQDLAGLGGGDEGAALGGVEAAAVVGIGREVLAGVAHPRALVTATEPGEVLRLLGRAFAPAALAA
jgi:hypothetical protein